MLLLFCIFKTLYNYIDLFRGAWQRLRNAFFEARGWQNRRKLYAELGEMSEYYQLLQGPAKERYVEKLRLLGFTESDDPYSESNAGKFIENLTR